jgi:hypothetical protein
MEHYCLKMGGGGVGQVGGVSARLGGRVSARFLERGDFLFCG